MTEYLDKNTAVDEGYLADWYIHSLVEYNDEKLNEPRWTEEHIEELINDFIVIPNDTPAADVAPVKHGKWIEYQIPHYFKCSECKCTVPYVKAVLIDGKRKYNYCPACGAKMDEVTK